MKIDNEREFIETFDWLMETPINQTGDRRQLANASIAQYVEDHAQYDVDLDIKLLKFADSSPELLTIFIGGYTECMMENPDANSLDANVAGSKKVIGYYQKNKEFLDKDRKIEKLIRKEQKDKLKKYVGRKMK